MSQKDDLIQRLMSRPRDFELRELERLLGLCNCQKSNAGRTSGPAMKFTHVADGKKSVFSFHKPHPESTEKRYIMDAAIDFLKEIGEI